MLVERKIFTLNWRDGTLEVGMTDDIQRQSKRPRYNKSKKQRQVAQNSDIVESLVEDVMQLEDINADPNGESSKNQDKSALGQFLGFYNTHVSPVSSFDDIMFQKIDKRIIGLFCDYMIKNPDIGWQSTMNYLSCVRRLLETKHGVDLFNKDPAWYKSTRKNVTRAYVLTCIKGVKAFKI